MKQADLFARVEAEAEWWAGNQYPPGFLEFPMARASDPVESHAAADRAMASGLVSTQRAALLRAVEASPGSTASELGRGMGHATNHVACRRLPELEANGLVHRGEPRACRVTTFKAATWLPGGS